MVIRSKTGHDFSLTKRTNLNPPASSAGSPLHNINDHLIYLRYLLGTRGRYNSLFKELLINVDELLFANRSLRGPEKEKNPSRASRGQAFRLHVRVWGARVRQGREAYSIAMVIREYTEAYEQGLQGPKSSPPTSTKLPLRPRGPAFSSPMSPRTYQAAYCEVLIKEKTGFRVRKDIRESIVFAVQNVTKDAPFTRLDLVSCRNVLIYMEPDLQGKAHHPFFSLQPKRGGVLLLGSFRDHFGHLSTFSARSTKKMEVFPGQTTISHDAHFAVAAPWSAITARRIAWRHHCRPWGPI